MYTPFTFSNIINRFISLILIATLVLFTSCFKDESPLVIIEYKADQDINTLAVENPYTIYNYYSYINLDSLHTVKTIAIESWNLGFEASPVGWHIKVNSATGYEIYPTGETDFSKNYSNTIVSKWLFDNSNGHPDSTAIGQWVSGAGPDYQYTNQVYLLGKNNGDGTYSIHKKLVFTKLTDTSIVFNASTPESTQADTITIEKDYQYNFVYYSFNNPNQTLIVEPPKNEWDIVTGSYRTILYTDDGIATPYTVRGVLSNYPNVEVSKVNNSDFYIATEADAVGLSYSNYADAIGYDWKDYNSSESSVYRIVPDQYYFIKTKSGKLVKMEFTSYINSNAEYGYPVITTVNF